MALLSQQEILNAVYDASTNKLNTSQTANVEVANNDGGDFRVSAIQGDGGLLRVSAIQDGAAALNVSAKSDSAGLLRMSAFSDSGATFNVSATLKAGTANIGYVSAVIDNGSVSAKQGDAGNLRVSSFFASLDTTNNVDKVEQQFSYYYLSATGIFTIKASPTLLHSITVNKLGTASTLKVYDNTSAASGLQMATINTALSENTLLYDAKMTAGLTVSTADAGAADLTITYR